VCKDYIGVLSEESLRKNFTLIYELVSPHPHARPLTLMLTLTHTLTPTLTLALALTLTLTLILNLTRRSCTMPNCLCTEWC